MTDECPAGAATAGLMVGFDNTAIDRVIRRNIKRVNHANGATAVQGGRRHQGDNVRLSILRHCLPADDASVRLAGGAINA